MDKDLQTLQKPGNTCLSMLDKWLNISMDLEWTTYTAPKSMLQDS